MPVAASTGFAIWGRKTPIYDAFTRAGKYPILGANTIAPVTVTCNGKGLIVQ